MDRNQTLGRVSDRTEPWDMIVIGGGATGVGCALDAATRGYAVLLVEQHDLGKGTSSRSTKLIHGGVRYLEQGNISLVREALKERATLLRNAPHTVRKQAFVVPCYTQWQKLYYGTGLKVYDLLAGRNSFGPSRTLSRTETLERSPNLSSEGLKGGVMYFDGQFDDTRLLFDLAAAAQKFGAAVLNYAKVSSLIKDTTDAVVGVHCEDVLSGRQFEALSGVVINATGAFCDSVRSMADEQVRPIVTLSQGIHLVFDRKFLPGDDALMIPRTPDGRVLFCIPWLGSTLVGTTETPASTAVLEPHALETEIDFVLETLGSYLDPTPRREDIRSVFAGIRPLVSSSVTRNTSKLSRFHTIVSDTAGLLTITGGKWTTYRQMAEDAVTRAAQIAGLQPRACITSTLEIKGPSLPTSAQPLHQQFPYTREDVVRAVRTELAQTVEDVLARRTRALFLDAAAAMEMAPEVAGIMAVELGQDKEWIDRQFREFNDVAAHYLA